MRFDIIIIGAGESGINKGMSLLKEGKRVAVVSAGRSTIVIRHAAQDIMDYDARLRQGTEIEKKLRNDFRRAGGVLLDGDEVTRAELITNGNALSVKHVFTRKLQDEKLSADTFYLATGTFVSRGLTSNYLGIREPIFDLDVLAPQTPAEWIDSDFFADQPFMHAHVSTTADGKAVKDGKAIDNLFPIGSIKG